MDAKRKITLDLRIVCAVLLVMIVGLFVALRPWELSRGETRTIEVSGEASTEAQPDEYVFNPSYQLSGTDRAAMQRELEAKVNGVVTRLKELGVAETDIVLSSSAYDNFWNDGTQEFVSSALTIEVANKELADTIQDYLATTTPSGSLSPYGTFSTEKRKELEDSVRTKAIEDARKKAERTAEGLGASLGKVVSVEDEQNGFAMPMMGLGGGDASTRLETASSLPILAGTQEITYTVRVTYEMR
jgi:uncharacterized protein